MLRKFSFLNSPSNTEADRNWRVFNENSSTLVRTDLVITDPAPVGTPTFQVGYFTLYGPIVFYQMRILLNNNDGWSADATIAMPYEVLNTTTSKTGDVGHLGTVYTGQTFRSYVFMNIGGTLDFGTAYTNTSGVDQKAMIQGWYFRN